ncbi:MAG: M15 family metallopeptidase [Clostridiaceae bacterium]|nr:M15 family metallopeptidase [Clostridiaceae bacterium]
MRRDMLCLMMAYPDFIKGVYKDAGGIGYIVMNSGQKIAYDDLKNKSYDKKLESADLEDMLHQIYPLNDIDGLMEQDYDPGRIRQYILLNEVYGKSEQQVNKNLENVRAGNKNLSFNKNNKASEQLREVFSEISVLVDNNKSIYAFVFPVNGTFNYRVIAGTSQLSPHSFGIAIDLRSDKRDYWRWATREQGQERISQYPREVVRIFEKHNFIWGGKWGHFDILHFEYRPELIIKAKYYVEDYEMLQPWYYGFPSDEAEVREFIDIIENGLGSN